MTPELIEAQRRLAEVTAALSEAIRERDLAVLAEYRSGSTPREIAVELSVRTPTITAALRRVLPKVDAEQLSLFELDDQAEQIAAHRVGRPAAVAAPVDVLSASNAPRGSPAFPLARPVAPAAVAYDRRPTLPSKRRKARASTEADRDKATEARQEKLTVLQGQLVASVAELRSGEDWQRALGFAARFHNYSFNNQMLIGRQRPDATMVAGYEAWKTMGRQVDKGEKGIAILAPMTRRVDGDREQAEGVRPAGQLVEPAADATGPRQIFGFRVAHVFDVSQTSGDPIPELPRPELLEGQAPARLWDALAKVATDNDFTLERGDCGGANGWTRFSDRTIRVRDDVSEAQAAKTLAHEIGHMLLHDAAAFTDGTTRQCRGVQEVEAESVAYLVSAHAGMDSSGYTFAYVASWAESVEDATPEDVIRSTGKRVVDTSGKVIEAIDTALATPAQLDAHAALTDRVAVGARDATGLALRAETLTAITATTTTAEQVVTVQASTRQAVTVVAEVGPDRGRLLSAHVEAAEFYTAQLTSPSGTNARGYLAERGGSDMLGDRDWHVGYAPPSWTALTEHLTAQGFTAAELIDGGLSFQASSGRLVDRFRERIMFGIHGQGAEWAGQPIVGFVGRTPDALVSDRNPKYLNTRETAIFHKSEILYGLAERPGRHLDGYRPVVVEGPLDAYAVSRSNGQVFGAATLGTALTPNQVALLVGTVGAHEGVIVATDGDAAGRAAAERAYHLLTPAFERSGQLPGQVFGVQLPDGSDPASLRFDAGGDRLSALLLDRIQPLADLVVAHRLDQFAGRLEFPEGQVAAMRSVVPLIAGRPDDHAAALMVSVQIRTSLEFSTIAGAVLDYRDEHKDAAFRHVINHDPRPDLSPDARPVRTVDPTVRLAIAQASARLTAGEPVEAQAATSIRIAPVSTSSAERG